MNENFAQQEIFEEKTEKNFTVADKAIKSHSNYINDLDAKLVRNTNIISFLSSSYLFKVFRIISGIIGIIRPIKLASYAF